MDRRLGGLCAFVLAACAACGASPPETRGAGEGEAAATALSAVSEPAPGAQAAPSDARAVPAGFVEMTVAAVIHTDSGPAVILEDLTHDLLLPIAIGEAEALAIQVRVDRYRFQRPLTHDLLDAMLGHLGGTIVEVRVDGIRDGVFLGTVLLGGPDGVAHLDARPSDSIALAVGHRAPIFVSTSVVDSAGIPRQLLEQQGPAILPAGEADQAPLEL